MPKTTELVATTSLMLSMAVARMAEESMNTTQLAIEQPHPQLDTNGC